MLKELRNTLIRRDAMIAEYNSNVGMRYANLLGVALVFTLVAQPPLGVALLIVSGAIANLLSYGSIVTTEAHKLKAGYLLLPITPDSEIDCCIDASKGAERYILQAIKHFGEDAVIELAESSPQSFYAMIRDFQALAIEVDEMESGEANQAELAAIDTMRSIYFGGTKYDHAPRPETRPAPNLPSYRLPIDETPAPRGNRRSLPTPETPDYWSDDDLPDNHGTSNRYLLQAAVADTLPKIRDLPQEIATLKRHVLFVASTTSGKTTALTQVISHALSDGHQVTVLDGKGNKSLKDSGAIYRHCNNPERAMDAIEILEKVVATMETRQDLALKGHTDFTPITIIIDELNLIRAFLKKISKEALESFSELIVHILLQGAASNIFLRLAAHTSRLPKIGLDGGEADSLSFVALGRNGSYESLEDCLDYQVNGRKSKKFQDELDSLIHEDFPETLCFSTIAPMGFYRLPWVDQSATVLAPKPEMDYRERLERLIEKTAPEPTTKKATQIETNLNLEFPLGEILEHSKKNGTIKARDIQSNLNTCRKLSATDIREYFLELENNQHGFTEGEGSSMTFTAYQD